MPSGRLFKLSRYALIFTLALLPLLIFAQSGVARAAPAADVPLQNLPDQAETARSFSQPTQAESTPHNALLQSSQWPPVGTTFLVNSTDDAVDADPYDGVCQTSAADGSVCTLRAAIQETNTKNDDGTVIIAIPSGTYTLTTPNVAGDEDGAATGDLDITARYLSNLQIIGQDTQTTIIDGAGIDRVFEIEIDHASHDEFWAKDHDFAFSNMTIIGGQTTGGGGGIDIRFRNNSVHFWYPIFTFTTRFDNVAIKGNQSSGLGGGIYTHGQLIKGRINLVITNSTLSGNRAANGGGIWTAGGGEIESLIKNSTISGNHATGYGGGLGIGEQFILALQHTTLSNNTAVVGAGGIYIEGGNPPDWGPSPRLRNSIVANNRVNTTRQNCIGLPTLGPGNIIDDTTCGTSGVIVVPNAGLGVLQDNEGSTPTHALLEGSLAIDTADAGYCLATDQRGIARPQSLACDIGAYEYESDTPITTPDLTVNSTLDKVDADPTDGVCETASGNGVCTLRAAIQEANHQNGPQTISVPGGMYRLSISGTGENLAAKGDLDITDDVTIIGDGPAETLISGNYLDRILHIMPSHKVNIFGVTIRNGGNTRQCGGGISNSGTLSLTNSQVSNNRVVNPGVGGGICNYGSLLLANSTVKQNAAARGGGIYTTKIAQIIGSTITSNSAYAGIGGGIAGAGRSGSWASLNLTNSTVSSNTASGGTTPAGSGLYGSYLMVVITNSTIYHNRGATSSGIEAVFSSSFTLRNTIIADHSGPNCRLGSGSMTSSGNNLSDDDSCNLTSSGDLVSTEPGLGPLQNNGGLTFTHAPAVGSPVLDAGNNATCPAVDQRGIARDTTCDIGAYEGSSSDIVLTMDLVAEGPYLNQFPSLGETATAGVVISNRGTKAVGAFQVRFRYYKLEPSDPYNPARKTLLHTSVQDVITGLAAGGFVRITDSTFVVLDNNALYEVEVTVDPGDE